MTAGVAIFVVLAACTGSNELSGSSETLGPTLAEGEPCSAAGLQATTEPRNTVPEVVETLRVAIIQAALRCDFEGLAQLAESSPAVFDASVDSDDDLATYWSRQEAAGEEPLRFLVGILRGRLVSTIRGPSEFHFPSAAAFGTWEETPETVRTSLLEFYDSDDLAGFAAEDRYTGYRTGFNEDGAWLYFFSQ